MVTLLFKTLKHIGLYVILQSYSETLVFCIQVCCKSNTKSYECECVKSPWIAAVEIAAIYHCLPLWGWNKQSECHIYCIYNAVLRSSLCADALDRGTYKYRCVCCEKPNRFEIITSQKLYFSQKHCCSHSVPGNFPVTNSWQLALTQRCLNIVQPKASVATCLELEGCTYFT